jgi:enoyl-CoA hydratase
MDLILTGRRVEAEEAYTIGLANRVVEEGKAREHAVKLAHEIANFPQVTLRADRASAIGQWGRNIGDALQYEFECGKEALAQAALGAAKFAAGAGRHGIGTLGIKTSNSKL